MMMCVKRKKTRERNEKTLKKSSSNKNKYIKMEWIDFCYIEKKC